MEVAVSIFSSGLRCDDVGGFGQGEESGATRLCPGQSSVYVGALETKVKAVL